MISRKYLIALFLFLLASQINHALAQKVLYQVGGTLSDFSTLALGDSILFTYHDKTSGQNEIRSRWITDTTVVAAKVNSKIFAAINFGDDVYLYSLEGKKRSHTLNIDVLNKRTQVIHPLDSALTIGGTILGSFIDHKSIFFIMLGGEGEMLSVFEVNKSSIISDSTYTLPISIADYVGKESPVEFYTSQSEVNSFKGTAKVKFYKYDDKYYITVDQPEILVTHFITINPKTGKVYTSTFKSPSAHDFGSFYFDGRLFRTVLGKKSVNVIVYDVSAKDILGSTELVLGQIVSPIYFRYGRKNVINNRIKTESLLASAIVSEGLIEVFKKDEEYIIQTGTYYNKNKGSVFVATDPVTLLVAAATTLIYNAIQAAREKPGVSRYFYYRYSGLGDGIKLKDPALETLKEKIDNYEITQNRLHIRFRYKSYIPFKEGILCTYYSGDTLSAKLVYFGY